jgi:hypothetical protein
MRILQVRKLQIRRGFPRLCNLILLFINQPESAPPGTLSAGVITRGERVAAAASPPSAQKQQLVWHYLIKEASSREMYIFTSGLRDENQIYLSGRRVRERDETVRTLSRLTNFAFLINTSSTGKAETQKNNPRFAEKRN